MGVSQVDDRIEAGELKQYLEERVGASVQIREIRQLRGETKGATASKRAYRQAVRERVARFAEVYVDCPPEVCRARDPKGLWERADRGEITALPGAGASYEPPEMPEVRVDTARYSAEESARQILRQLTRQGEQDMVIVGELPPDKVVIGVSSEGGDVNAAL
jgi:hypothetical protein